MNYGSILTKKPWIDVFITLADNAGPGNKYECTGYIFDHDIFFPSQKRKFLYTELYLANDPVKQWAVEYPSTSRNKLMQKQSNMNNIVIRPPHGASEGLPTIEMDNTDRLKKSVLVYNQLIYGVYKLLDKDSNVDAL